MRMTRDGIGVTAEQVFEIGLALPGVQRRDSGEYVSLRVSDKGFAYFSPDGARFQVKATRDEQEAWVAENPATYSKSWASGRFGWIDVLLARTRHDEVAELVTEAWRLTAPVRLTKLLG
jgi:hypothetical protein